jgi:hypothetical protein
VRVDDAQREIQRAHDLLARLDHPAPALRAADVMRRAGTRPYLLRWAAGLILAALAAGAAYALPGSPLRDWLDRSQAGADSARAVPAPATDTLADSAAAAGAGMILDPSNAHIVVRAAGGSRITIELVTGTDVEVSAVRGRPAFDQQLDQLVIDGRGDVVDYMIRVPRQASRVVIQLGGRTIFAKRGAAIESSLQPDSTGRYIMVVDSVR